MKYKGWRLGVYGVITPWSLRILIIKGFDEVFWCGKAIDFGKGIPHYVIFAVPFIHLFHLTDSPVYHSCERCGVGSVGGGYRRTGEGT